MTIHKVIIKKNKKTKKTKKQKEQKEHKEKIVLFCYVI
jgi:hypothetical protein